MTDTSDLAAIVNPRNAAERLLEGTLARARDDWHAPPARASVRLA
jgi:hypothetical protein